MGVLLESLRNYFRNTPKEQLDKDWKEIEYLNEIGPDVFEYAEFVKANFGIEMMYSNVNKEVESLKCEVSDVRTNNSIAADALYCMAA